EIFPDYSTLCSTRLLFYISCCKVKQFFLDGQIIIKNYVISYPIALPLSSKKGAGYLFLLLFSKRESRKWLYFSQ
ncbi:hypothetical protein, partial [Prevotella nigrescens]|uniref:hypothetical protein n=1 Tax=Prevotella nigrescens TaxID=28133 RepID=UPI0028D07175